MLRLFIIFFAVGIVGSAGYWYMTVPQPLRFDRRVEYFTDSVTVVPRSLFSDANMVTGYVPNWMIEKADAGNLVAQVNIAKVATATAPMKPLTWHKAYQYVDATARFGIPESQFMLGKMYETGNQVEENKIEAYVWYRLAAEGGIAEAAGAQQSIGQQLDPQTLLSAEQRFSDWLIRHGQEPQSFNAYP